MRSDLASHGRAQALEVADQILLPMALPFLFSKMNGRSYGIGTLETPSLAQLRQRAAAVTAAEPSCKLRTSVVVGDVGAMHRDTANRDALFQVASQFNLLEMVHPGITPEHGVTRYVDDRTQGPAGAIAAGAATIYRNYFAPVGDQVGQTSARQIDCLADPGVALGRAAYEATLRAAVLNASRAHSNIVFLTQLGG